MLGQARKPRLRKRQAVRATPTNQRSKGRRATRPNQPSQACIMQVLGAAAPAWVPQGTQLGGVGANGGEGQGALAQGAMGGCSSTSRIRVPSELTSQRLPSCSISSAPGCRRSAAEDSWSGKGLQLRHAGGGRERQQELRLGRSAARHRRSAAGMACPPATWPVLIQAAAPPTRRRVRGAGAGRLERSASDHPPPGSGVASVWQADPPRRVPSRQCGRSSGASARPIRRSQMPVAQARREQHGPELVTTEKHHHTGGWPRAMALGPQQQPPKA